MIQRLFLGCLCILGLNMCTTDTITPWNDLEVVVTDEQENVASQVIVKLYTSKTAYEEGLAWDSLITDAQGTAFFTSLDPKVTELYVEAIKGTAKNWSYRHKISMAPGKNRVITKVIDSNENLLIGKAGKEWKQIDYVAGGESFSDCKYRRIHRFEQAGIMYISTSDECTWSENISLPEVWSLSQNQITIGPPTNPQAQRIGTIQVLNDKRLQFFYQKAGANGLVTHIETFEAVD